MKRKIVFSVKLQTEEIPSKTLYEDGDFRVILDLGPATRGHALILPREHADNLYELPGGYDGKSICSCKKDGNKDDREITLRWSQYRTE